MTVFTSDKQVPQTTHTAPPGDNTAAYNPHQLVTRITDWARDLGFQQVGISGIHLDADEARLLDWLAAGRHGQMHWMARHGRKRSHPDALLPGTVSVISARMDYWPGTAADAQQVLDDPALGYVSRYALGRDYHKLLRTRLQKLATKIESHIGPFNYRAFSDSAPVLEKPLARNAGLGWIGKHTNLINRGAGSWFFIAELYTDLALPAGVPDQDHCGTCEACIQACPSAAITAPYQLDARRCISYLSIELDDPIPVALRRAMGNRIYGCDDCQLVCPWNRFAKAGDEADFAPRRNLDATELVSLFAWTQEEFQQHLQGSAIRRIGHRRFIRNIAVALGNAPTSTAVIEALRTRRRDPSALIREHVHWALEQHEPHTAPDTVPDIAATAPPR